MTCPRCRGTGLRLWTEDAPCGLCTDAGRESESAEHARRRAERLEARRIEHAKFDGPGWGVLTSAGPWGRVCELLDEAKDLALAATELHLVPVTVVKVRERENMLDHYMGTFERDSDEDLSEARYLNRLYESLVDR